MCVFFFTVCLVVFFLLFNCKVMSNFFGTLWTLAYQAPLSMGFPRKGYWSGLPFPSVGDLPNPETKPKSPELAGEFLTTESPGSPSRVLDTI